MFLDRRKIIGYLLYTSQFSREKIVPKPRLRPRLQAFKILSQAIGPPKPAVRPGLAWPKRAQLRWALGLKPELAHHYLSMGVTVTTKS